MTHAPKGNPQSGGLSRGEKFTAGIALLGIFVAIMIGASNVIVPEIRRYLGLSSSNTSAPPILPIPAPRGADGKPTSRVVRKQPGKREQKSTEPKTDPTQEDAAEPAQKETVQNILHACTSLKHPELAGLFTKEYRMSDHLELHFDVIKSSRGNIRFSGMPTAACLIQVYELHTDGSLTPEAVEEIHRELTPIEGAKDTPWFFERSPANNAVAYVILGYKTIDKKADEDLMNRLATDHRQDVSGWAIDTKPLPK